MKVEQAATENEGVWVTFLVIAAIYVVRGRHPRADPAPDGPAVPRRRVRASTTTCRTARARPLAPSAGPRVRRGAGLVSERGRGRAVLRRHRLRAVRRRRLRGGLLGPHRGRRRTRRAAPRGREPLDRAGVGSQPRLADLLPRRAVDRVLRGVRVDHAHAVRAVVAGRARHRAARLELRVPQGSVTRVVAAQLRRRVRDRRRCSCRSASARWPARSHPGGCRPAAIAGDPWSSWINPTSILGGVLAVVVCAYLAAVYLVWDARALRRRRTWSSTSAGGRWSPAWSPASSRSSGIFVLHDDAEYLFDGLITGRALPLVIVSALCGLGSLVLLLRQNHRGARAARDGRGRRGDLGLGRRAVALPASRDAEGRPPAPPPTRRCGRSSSCSGSPPS